jgi:hypothetical protein
VFIICLVKEDILAISSLLAQNRGRRQVRYFSF